MIRKSATFAAILLLALVATAVYAGGNSKVEICHFPPGNPANFHTITISENAFSAHVAHGDLNEACNALCAEICDDQDPCTVDDTADCEQFGCPTTPLPVDCDDELACTDDFCDSALGGCQNEPLVCIPSDLCHFSDCAEPEGMCLETEVVCGENEICIPDAGCVPDEQPDGCVLVAQSPVLGPLTGQLARQRTALLFNLVNPSGDDLSISNIDVAWSNLILIRNLEDFCYEVPPDVLPEDCESLVNVQSLTPASLIFPAPLLLGANRDAFNPMIVGFRFDLPLATLDPPLGETIRVDLFYQASGIAGDVQCSWIVETNPLFITAIDLLLLSVIESELNATE